MRVTAPSGKLGVHFNDVHDEAVVRKLNDNSPMNGRMKPGDRIVSVNGTDTRGMNKLALAKVVGAMAQQERTFVVRRSPQPAPCEAAPRPPMRRARCSAYVALGYG